MTAISLAAHALRGKSARAKSLPEPRGDAPHWRYSAAAGWTPIEAPIGEASRCPDADMSGAGYTHAMQLPRPEAYSDGPGVLVYEATDDAAPYRYVAWWWPGDVIYYVWLDTGADLTDFLALVAPIISAWQGGQPAAARRKEAR